MKPKIFAILALALAMLFTLIACDGNNDKPSDTTANIEIVTTEGTTDTASDEEPTTVIETTAAESTAVEEETTVEEITSEEVTTEEATTEEATTEEVTTEEGTTAILTDDEIALTLTEFAKRTQDTKSYAVNADLQVKMTVDTGVMKIPVIVPYTMVIKENEGDMYMSMTDSFTFTFCGGVLYVDYPQIGKIKVTLSDSQALQFIETTGATDALKFTPEDMRNYFGKASGYKNAGIISVKLEEIGSDFLTNIMSMTMTDSEVKTEYLLDKSYITLTMGTDYSIKYITVSIAFRTEYEGTPTEAVLSGKITYDTKSEIIIQAPDDVAEYIELSYEVLCSFLGIEDKYDEATAAALGISKELDSLTLSTDAELFEKQVDFLNRYGKEYLGKPVTLTATYNEIEIFDGVYTRTLSNIEGGYFGVISVDINGNEIENGAVVTVSGEIVDLGSEAFHEYAVKVNSVSQNQE